MEIRKGIGTITLAVILVSGLIGLVIVNSLAEGGEFGVRVPATGNETVGSANATGYLSATLASPPVAAATEQIFCNASATTNYTLTDATGTIVVNGADCTNDTVRAAYYNANQQYSNTLSRIIVRYVVPIAMLGLLAFAAA